MADDLATAHGEADAGARIDALWVRLTCQPQLAHQSGSVSRPFEALADGTLREAATAVWPAAAVDVWHRSWRVTSAEAAHWTERLIVWVAE